MREELPRKGMEVHPPEERGIGLKRLRGGSGEGFSTFKAFLRLLCGAFLELERFSNIQRPFLPQGRAGSRGVQLSIYSLLSPVPAVFSRASARPLQARKPAAIAPSVFGATLPAHSLDLFRACPSFAAARFHKPAAHPAKFAFPDRIRYCLPYRRSFPAHPPGLCRHESLPPLRRPYSARRFPRIPLVYSGPALRSRPHASINRPRIPQNLHSPIKFAIIFCTGSLFPRIRPAFAGTKACRHCAVRIRRDAARAFP